MEDRTADLLRARKSTRPEEAHNDDAIEKEKTPVKLEGVQAEVAEITTLLNRIRDNTDHLEKNTAHKRYDGLQKIIEETNVALLEVRGKIAALSKGMNKDEIRKNQYKRLNEQFKTIGQRYKDMQVTYKESLLDSVTNEARVVAPNMTREEVRMLIEQGKDSTFFADKLMGEAHARAKEEYRFITGWYQDLKRLEESMIELHGLFLDVSLQVETQAEQLDQTEKNLDQADADAVEAVKHLGEAKKHAANKRQRRACCCCAVGTAGALAAGGAGAAAYLNGCNIM
eukprot:TRINITY_DN2145_c0_g1_i1.p1 TRINITY_DN2145_c0_g1~~TRINITY_DN2145_c0_g1_i1.p1  ORF type:complete len:284 (-),score=79.36 TRINITY_DN2145_c0_g1_i1:202-1053(-)